MNFLAVLESLAMVKRSQYAASVYPKFGASSDEGANSFTYSFQVTSEMLRFPVLSLRTSIYFPMSMFSWLSSILIASAAWSEGHMKKTNIKQRKKIPDILII